MFEVVMVLGALIALVLGGGIIVRSYLNDVRDRLEQIGLPLTFGNAFFLTAHGKTAARTRGQEDEYLWFKEMYGPRLYLEMLTEVEMTGSSWRGAAEKVLKSSDKALALRAQQLKGTLIK